MTDDQIKHMVGRFLSWRLPDNFNPDNGISFKPTFNDSPEAMKALGLTEPMRCNPVGTNLLDATQAEAMVRFMAEGLPVAYPYSEEMCPGHVASVGDSMICGRCGVHVRSLAPDDEPTP